MSEITRKLATILLVLSFAQPALSAPQTQDDYTKVLTGMYLGCYAGGLITPGPKPNPSNPLTDIHERCLFVLTMSPAWPKITLQRQNAVKTAAMEYHNMWVKAAAE